MTTVRLLCLVLFLAVGSCHTQEKPKEPPPPKKSAGAADVDPEAGRILFLMGASLGNAEGMSFTADIVYEEVLETGLKFERSLSVDIKARRPDRLRVEFSGSGDRRLLTCDGKTVTLVEQALGLFGACPAAATLDATLDLIAEDHGITVPCDDFLFSDPYAVLSENLKAGSYLGLVKLRGLPAHHLVFSQEGLDWQIWIDTGPKALPLRMVMTYVDAEGAPRFEADLKNWHLNPSLPDAVFTADVTGMEKIDFQNSAESME